MIIAGVMSGSSLDGLDIALVEFFEDGNWKAIDTFDLPLSDDMLVKIKNYHQLTASEYIQFTYDFSYFIGYSLRDAFKSRASDVDYISFHGHTLVHNPDKGYTEQIGNGAIVAGVTGIPTITEFRNQDIVQGGQGTPLAPIVDFTLFAGYDYYLNLGGIANITSIANETILAYDICPCNQVLNHYSKKLGHEYDENGGLAKKGELLSSISEYLDSVLYFKKSTPKSLDNNWIQNSFIPQMPAGNPVDILHSYSVWMSGHIAMQVNENASSRLLVSGGGTHNGFFIDLLRKALGDRGCELIIPKVQIVNYKEAILMSLLGYKYLNDEANVLGSVTGASKNTIGGSLHKCTNN